MSAARTCEGRLNGPLQIHGRSHDHPETNIGATEWCETLLLASMDTIVHGALWLAKLLLRIKPSKFRKIGIDSAPIL